VDVGADWRVAYPYLKGTVAISKGNRRTVLCNVKHAGGESVWDAEFFAAGARGLAPCGLRTLRLFWAEIRSRGKGLLFRSAHTSKHV
jgi:hypothetical protein